MTVHFSCIHAKLFYNGLGRIIYVFIPFYPEKINRNRPSRFLSSFSIPHRCECILEKQKSSSKNFIIDVFYMHI